MPRPAFSTWLKRLLRTTRQGERPWKERDPVRLRLEMLEDRWLPTLYVVTTPLDLLNDTTPGEVTLRDALNAVSTQAASGNAAAGTASNTIRFAIGTIGSVQTISVGSNGNGPLPTITHQVDILGFSQGGGGYSGPPLIVINGASAGNFADGLTFDPGSDGSSVRGLCIQQFRGSGIVFNGTSGNLVVGNYIGTDVNGTAALGNGSFGVSINSGSANTIGGVATADRNIISGNGFDVEIDFDGVNIFGGGASGNLVAGNYIGTDVTGTADLGNAGNGVAIENASGNTIGGLTNTPGTGLGNVISGNNRSGVHVLDSGGVANSNVVWGNLIGTNVSGTASLGNDGDGVFIEAINSGLSAADNTIGGPTASSRNVISGNGSNGVEMLGISGSAVTGNVITGNYIGTDINGTVALGNGQSGVFLHGGAAGNTVGTGNVISGNTGDGVEIEDASTSGNLVVGNLIGTDVNGTAALGNSQDGVFIAQNAAANTVGGLTASDRNVISGNRFDGVGFQGVGTSGNLVAGNYIGTDKSGTAALGNGLAGVFLRGGAAGNTVGTGNVISGNTGDGVQIEDASTSGNLVVGNLIGTDGNGTAALGNSQDGVFIGFGAAANTVGGLTAGARNVISANRFDGVGFQGVGTSGNLVAGNYIGTDKSGTADLGNSRFGVLIASAAANTMGGATAGARNIISGNNLNGVSIQNAGASGNVVLGNYIGTDVNGTAALGNSADGVRLDSDATLNTVGGVAAGEGNVISANNIGVEFAGPITNNTVVGNLIGLSVNGTAALGNQVGLLIEASGQVIDETTAAGRNTIQANTVAIELATTATNNTVLRLRLSTNAGGTSAAAFPNGTGLLILGNDNTVGGATFAGNANVFSGNSNTGVEVRGATGNLIQHNFIGTDINGTAALGNDGNGITIDGAAGNTISGNVISGNGHSVNEVGVAIGGAGASGNLVLGNLIGTDVNGTAALGNTGAGVGISNGAVANTVGGSTVSARNLISGNGNTGVSIVDLSASGNLVQYNYIGTDVNGTAALGNFNGGVGIVRAANNTVSGNLISGNIGDGVTVAADIFGNPSTGNLVVGNMIGTDLHGTAALPNVANGLGNGVSIIDSSANTVGGSTLADRNLISGNSASGVLIRGAGASGNRVLGNYIGTDVNGTAILGNNIGVLLSAGAARNTVGGTSAATRNVISGNVIGVNILGAGTSGNLVLGNSIGQDVNGTLNLGNFNEGVAIGDAATANTIGGAVPGATNVITGTGTHGVEIFGAGTSGNVVAGNRIGTDRTGTVAMSNFNDGVGIFGATANTIGGTTAAARNIISANGGHGVQIVGEGTSRNVVLGNLIGTDVNGTADLGNTLDGVFIAQGATQNTVGGTSAGARNVISGNDGHGVEILNQGTSGNVVAGNYIGTDVNGTVDLGNSQDGVVIAQGATKNTVGGTSAGARNVISGNDRRGVTVNDPGTTGNLVAGNYIGTASSGTAALGNSAGGVFLSGSSANTVGGVTAGARNVISGNRFDTPNNIADGVTLQGVGTSGNLVAGNFIGTDASGTRDLGNRREGVFISIGATANTVGGVTASARNVISGNDQDGIGFLGAGTSGNLVAGNFIGTDVSGTRDLGNTGDGVFMADGPSANTVGGVTAGARNLLSGNDGHGVEFSGAGTSGNLVAGNRIGTDVSGTRNLHNNNEGVHFNGGASQNTVGGTVAGAGNVIAFNLRGGVSLLGNTTVGNSVLRNSIFANTGPGIDLGDDGPTANGLNPRAFPNRGQNYPVLTTVTATSVSGVLRSTPRTTFRLEFFASPASGPSFQGKTFLGFKTVTTDASGTAVFTAPLTTHVANGQLVTATATNLITGDTSEFSRVSTSVRVNTNPVVLVGTQARITLRAVVTSGPTRVPTGTVTFTVFGLPGVTATVGVSANGVATFSFQLPRGTRPGRYLIVATYHHAGAFTDSSSNPFGNGVLTVLSLPNFSGRRWER